MEKFRAIKKLYPNVVTMRDDIAYDENGNQVAIDEPLVQIEIDAVAYKQKRAEEYPPLAEQLDYIYHNGIEAWKADMILPVKNKYPKG